MSSALLERAVARETKIGVIDCDVHHAMRSPKDLYPYLPARWREHLETYGSRRPTPFTGSSPYFKAAPALSRKDAWPRNGGPPGSDLAFLQEQLLDRYGIEAGMLHLLSPTGMDQRNQELAPVLCRAINQWQFHEWTQKDQRLKAAIVVPGEDAAAAVAEIEHWAGNRDFAQVSVVTHTIEPLGRRRYWPIFAAAQANNLSIGLHIGGTQSAAPSAGGWPQFYVEDHHMLVHSMQNQAASLILEGVFEAFPNLKICMIEGGFAWVPSLGWRLDAHWAKMRDEVPQVKRPPSEYMRTNLWFATQPVEEPENPDDLRQVFEWIGWDRMIYSSDYPHWDFDDPHLAFRFQMTDQEKRMLFRENALNVYTFR